MRSCNTLNGRSVGDFGKIVEIEEVQYDVAIGDGERYRVIEIDIQ